MYRIIKIQIVIQVFNEIVYYVSTYGKYVVVAFLNL